MLSNLKFFSCGLTSAALLSLSLTTLSDDVTSNKTSDNDGTVTIIGSKEQAKKVSGSAHVISEDDLAEFEYTDVQRALRTVPGIYIQEEEGFGLRPNIGIRGSGTERSANITLMEDGILIAPAPYAASSAYYFPTFGRITGVEVLKGSAATQYGPQTIGGAVNLLSKPIPEMESGSINLEFGEFDTRRIQANVGDSNDTSGWLVQAHQHASNGFKTIDRNNRDQTGFDKTDYLVKFRLNSAPGVKIYQELNLKLQYSEEVSDQSYLGLTDNDFNQDAYRLYGLAALDQFNAEHDQQILSHYVEFSDTLNLTTSIYNNEFYRNWFKTEGIDLDGSIDAQSFDRESWASVVNAINNDTSLAGFTPAQLQNILNGNSDTPVGSIQLRANEREYYSRGIQFDLNWNTKLGNASHTIKAGIRSHEDREDRLQRNSNYQQLNGTLVLNDLGLLGNARNRIQQAEALSLYVKDDIDIGKWLFTLGLRYEDIKFERFDYGKQPLRNEANLSYRQNNVSEVLPGVGVVFKMNNQFSFIAGINKGFGVPGNSPNTDPEESVNYEIGSRINFANSFVEAIYFHNDYDNILGECTNQSGGSCDLEDEGEKFNGNGATVKGLELLFNTDLSSSNSYAMPLRVNYTYTDAQFDSTFDSNFFGNVAKGDSLPYLARNIVQANIGLEKNLWKVYANASYIDEMCTDVSCDEFAMTDSLFVVDLSLHYQFSKKTNLYMTVDNLFDDEAIIARQPYGARPAKPQTTSFGIKYEF